MGCRPKFSHEDRARAIELVRSGMSQSQAARVVGCGHALVSKWWRAECGTPYIRPKPKPRKPPKPRNKTHEEKDRSRRAYLARLMREALPGAIKAAREEMRRLEDT